MFHFFYLCNAMMLYGVFLTALSCGLRGPPKKRKKKNVEDRNSETSIVPAPTMMYPPSIDQNSTSSARSVTRSNEVPLLLLEDGAAKKGKRKSKVTKAKDCKRKQITSTTKRKSSTVAPASPAMNTRSKASSPAMGTRSKVGTTNSPATGIKRKLYS